MKSSSGFCICSFFLYIAFVRAKSSPELVITNDGPAILGSNITFSAILRNYEAKHELMYVFDDGKRKTEHSTKSLNISESRAFGANNYTDISYFMNVTVTVYNFFWKETVLSNFTIFELRRDLIGSIYVYRSNTSTFAIDVDEVAVGENSLVVLDLHDPNGYLDDAIIEYGWSVDFERVRTSTNTLLYNFTEAGVKHIQAVATALLPNKKSYYGAFSRTITAKVPVNSINVTGNPFLYHGDKLNLNITCNGTPPFVYCYEILKANITRENFTCTHLSTFTNCRMEILRYIQEDGTYNVGIYVSNDVREVKRVIEVMVYSVSVNPTLSIVIIPLVFSLLALGIIAAGIAYCVQQRSQMAVEVANFDFQDESDSYTERTFFENIFDQFMCRGCRAGHISVQSEEDPLI